MRAIGLRPRRVADDAAVGHRDVALRPGGDLRVVGDDHERCAGGGADSGDQLEHLVGVLAVELTGGFVGEQSGRARFASARAIATRCSSPPEKLMRIGVDPVR